MAENKTLLLKLQAVCFLSFALFFNGCSAQSFKAKIHAFKAESALSKAAGLKERKVDYQKRVPLYRRACLEYKAAFDLDPGVFTHFRIEEAMNACWRSNEPEHEELFRIFEQQYAAAHPQESEYGDAGVGMMEMV